MLERKVIHKGQGFRLTFQNYVGGWRGYESYTVVVRMPNRTRQTFLPRLVVTQGIQGQPQLTFDSYDAAVAWKELQTDENFRNCTVGHINKDYDCIKVPLDGGGEGWIAISNFPPEGDVEYWSWLENLFPDYFGVQRLGFFREKFENISEAYSEEVVTTGHSWKIKTPGEYNHTIKVLLPNTRRDTFKVSVISVSPYGGPGYGQICFLTKEDAEEWLEGFLSTHPEYQEYNFYVYSARVNLTLVKVPLEDGTEAYVRKEYLPVEQWNHEWWERMREIYPEYFKTQKLGFFESLGDHPTNEEILHVIENSSTDDQACRELFDGRDQDYIWDACLNHCRYFKAFAENGDRVPDCPNGGVLTYFVRNHFNENPMGIIDSYNYYVAGKTVQGYTKDATRILSGIDWWTDIVDLYMFWEQHDPEEFKFKKPKLGFFNEDINLTEDYNVPHETFKRVIIKYVRDNGYIKGGWNGRYMTPSPTVEELNRLLRHTEDLTDHMCTPEEYTEFSNWVSSVQPEGAQADWMEKCIASWDKTGNLTPEDLKNLVSFVSYHDSNIKFQQRQQARLDRERQHQERVAADTNTWAGEVGDTVTLEVAEAKQNYGMYGTIWSVTGTDGRVYTWGGEDPVECGDHVEGKIKSLSEFNGIKQTRLVRVKISKQRIGFFRESVTTDWILNNFGITIDELVDLCWKNWEWEWDECFEMWHDDHTVDVSNPFFDSDGIKEFDTIEESMEYYGEEFVKTWIKDFIKWCSDRGYIDHVLSTRQKIGFFN